MAFPSLEIKANGLSIYNFAGLSNPNRQINSIYSSTLFFHRTKLFTSLKHAQPTLSPERTRLTVRVYNQLQPSGNTQSSISTPILPHEEANASASIENKLFIAESNTHLETDNGNGGTDNTNGNGNGKFPPNGGGDGEGNGSGNGDEGKDENEEDEFGPFLSYEEVMREVEEKGITLPEDMLQAAKNCGIQKLLLLRYLEMQGSSWPLGDVMKSIPLFRNRMLADPSFLFKIGTEIIIDSCCATFAEVQKRGKEFWSEFELYTADLLVGVVVNIALVGMLAPYARFGSSSSAAVSRGLLGRLKFAYDALPSSVFEAERPGYRFSVQQRIGTYFYKGALYGAVGFFCGLVGQGIANLIMTAKRSVKKSDEDIPVPPLFKSAALWGVFLAVSSNTRYQVINGLERLVEASPVAKGVPPIAMAFTVGVRFANNIYGGMQFVDWARLTGCQ